MTIPAFIAVFILMALICAVNLPTAIFAWLWIALQSPQQLISTSLPANLIIVICTFTAMIFGRNQIRSPISKLTNLIFLYFIHVTITTIFSITPSYSADIYDRVWKTIILVILIFMFMTNRTRIHASVWVMVISLGLLAFKTSVFTIITGGNFRIWGPPNSQIFDNNHFGVAMIMMMPFSIYLVETAPTKAIKRLCFFIALCFATAAVFTYSRTAFISLTAVALCYWLLSRYKARIAIGVAVFLVLIIPLLPETLLNRLSTIESSGSRETADESVQARFNSWEAHWELATRRPLIGGGFRALELPEVWANYHPTAKPWAAHSAYFQTLGDHGFPGLIGFLILQAATIFTALRIRKRARYIPELAWARSLATACMLSTVAYSVGSLALSLATYDLFYIVVGIVACVARLTSDVEKGRAHG